ncbi:YraN family protein [Patescibacteria group bacterium]|nr:YraN family protein [Patescibacteria group bacterium]
MDRRQEIGQKGERLAINFLKTMGWTIKAHNYRIGHKEIDIIASKNNILSLFEIKTKINNENNYIISRTQQNTLRQAHLAFCDHYQLNPVKVSYSLIVITYKNKLANLHYYPSFL